MATVWNLLELWCRLNRGLRRFVPVIPSSDPFLPLGRPCSLVDVVSQLYRDILCQCLCTKLTSAHFISLIKHQGTAQTQKCCTQAVRS